MAEAGTSAAARRRLAVVAALLAIGLAPAGGAASAQDPDPTAEEYGLELVVGFGGRTVDVAWTPVEVRLTPDRPLRGTLTVVSAPAVGGAPYRETAAIEVGGGSAKAYRFVVPPGSVGVTVAEPGRRQVRATARAAGVPGYLVGRLDGDVEEVPSLRDDALGRNGTWVPVDAEWLALPRALDSLDGLVADATALAELPPAARQAVAAEVVAGLGVVLVSGPGSVDAAALGLPSDLAGVIDAQGRVTSDTDGALGLTEGTGAPAPTTAPAGDAVAVVAGAGNGRLVITSQRPSGDGAAEASRLWSAMAGVRGGVREGATIGALANNPFRLPELFASGRDEPPSIPWLAAFLVAYVVIVGPLNAVVLSRARRRELAWVSVPLVTAIFTVAGFAAATGGASEEVSAGRAVWWLDGAGRERVVAMVRATSDGPWSLDLDGAWAVRSLSDSGAPGVVTRGDRARVTMELRALQVGGLLAERPAPEPAPLEVDARSEGRGVRVAVRNTSAEPVAGVVILAATARHPVGSLAPGERADVLIDEQHLPAVDPYQWEQSLRGPPPPGRGRGPDVFEQLLRSDVLTGSPGVAWAVGQRPGGPTGLLSSAGIAAGDRGSLLAVGATVAPDAEGRAGPFAWHRVALPPDAVSSLGGPLHVDALDAVVRFRPPPGATLGVPLLPDLRPGVLGGRPGYDAWSAQDGVWLPIDHLFPDGAGDPRQVLGPAGDLYVRAQADAFPFELSGLGMSTVAEPPP